MSVTLVNAYLAQPGIADTTLYTCPGSTVARVIKCTVTNDTTTAVTISFNKRPAAVASGPANLIMNLRPIGSKETYECPEIVGQVFEATDLLSAIASVADQLTVNLDVVEIV
jgi:hypothetical protein